MRETRNEILKKEITSFLKSIVFYYEIEEWIFVYAPLKNSNIPLKKIRGRINLELRIKPCLGR